MSAEFDEQGIREKLAGSSREELTDMLIYAYKDKRLLANALGEAWKKLDRIQKIAEESLTPSKQQNTLTSEELRRLMEDDRDDRS